MSPCSQATCMGMKCVVSRRGRYQCGIFKRCGLVGWLVGGWVGGWVYLQSDVWLDKVIACEQQRSEALLLATLHKEAQQLLCQLPVLALCGRLHRILYPSRGAQIRICSRWFLAQAHASFNSLDLQLFCCWCENENRNAELFTLCTSTSAGGTMTGGCDVQKDEMTRAAIVMQKGGWGGGAGLYLE